MGDDLDRAARDLVVDAAVRGRARRGDRTSAAAELSTVAGVLVRAVGSGQEVALSITGAPPLRLTPTGVLADGLAGTTSDGGTELVSLRALASVELGSGPTRGPEPDPGPDTLAEVLAELVDERPEVAIWTTAGAEPIIGRLAAVGDDVVVVAVGARTHAVVIDRVARVRLWP